MDWQAFIRNLRQDRPGWSAMTIKQIADAVDAPPSTVSDLASGATKEPRATLGIALLQKFGNALEGTA